MKRFAYLPIYLAIALGPLCVLVCCAPLPDDNAPPAASAIRHLVVIVQENHTFDNYFGRYCTAAPGSNPTCTTGPACCEAAPEKDPGTGSLPVVLTDVENATYDPDHDRSCEILEINGGKMDRFVSNPQCGSPRNFAIAPPEVVRPYWQLAATSALADRYFQPVVGASSSNDMYLARAHYVFRDNEFGPQSLSARCGFSLDKREYTEQTIGDLLVHAGVSWTFYSEGYQAMLEAVVRSRCPPPPPECGLGAGIYPCVYDPSDTPFQYYPAFRDNPTYLRDLSAFTQDLEGGTLPAVSFVKAIGYKTEHPGAETNLFDGISFVTSLVEQILSSPYGASTLVLLAYDEGGGYFDHIAPPPLSPVDSQPYGTRVPFLAIGRFARPNHVSHATLEHSSIVKFIEWNWLAEKTGQLGTRDVAISNLGSLLDPAQTGTMVPED